jgi:hypothetical protein
MTQVATFPMFIEHPGDITDHPKVLALGQGERLAALGLYAVVGSWAARYAQDGTVPSSIVDMHDARGGRLSSALVAAGLWIYDDNAGTYRYAHRDALLSASQNGHSG